MIDQTAPANPLPIKVAAYLLASGDREDGNARAAFANMDYAERYARILANTGRYGVVFLWDAQGQAWEVPATVPVDSDGEPV